MGLRSAIWFKNCFRCRELAKARLGGHYACVDRGTRAVDKEYGGLLGLIK